MTHEQANKSVLHVCKVFLSERGGVQEVVEWICLGLQNQFKFTVLATSNAADNVNEVNGISIVERKSLINILSMPVSPSLIIWFWRRIRRFHLVVVHYPFPLVDFALSFYPRKLPPLIVYWHSEIVSQKLTSFLVRPFTRIMLHRADTIICSSPNLLEHSDLLVPHRRKCKVIPFGVPVFMEEYDKKPAECTYYLAICRHVPYKGLETLIRAYHKSVQRYELVIVGSGPLLKDHINLVAELGLQGGKVKFVTDADQEDKERLIRYCRALILPSVMESEAFGLVQIEAMAKGKPIINTDLKSGVPWVARNELEAVTVAPGDVTELQKALDYLSFGDTVNHLGEASLARARETFDHRKFCEATKQIYQDIESENV